MVKWLILQEDITVLSWYTLNNRELLIELKGEINEPTIIVGEFNTPLSEVNPADSKSVRT